MSELYNFTVMLEGAENGTGFFVSFDVLAEKRQSAEALAWQEAQRLGLFIVGCEEVNQQGNERSIKGDPVVLRTYGKSYFEC